MSYSAWGHSWFLFMPVNLSFSTYPFLPLVSLLLPLGWQDIVQFASPNWLLSMHNAFFILMNHQLALMAFFHYLSSSHWNFRGEKEGGKTDLSPHVLLRCWSQLSFFPSPCLLCGIFFPLECVIGRSQISFASLLLQLFFSGLLWTGESSQLLISLVTGCWGEACRSGERTGSSAHSSPLQKVIRCSRSIDAVWPAWCLSVWCQVSFLHTGPLMLLGSVGFFPIVDLHI